MSDTVVRMRIWVKKRYVPSTQSYEIEEEHYATVAQAEAASLMGGAIVEHGILSKNGMEDIRRWALVAAPGNKAIWVMPDGDTMPAEPPHFCYGNPHRANCIVHGYCRRNPACNN